jgi:hypothetical protein
MKIQTSFSKQLINCLVPILEAVNFILTGKCWKVGILGPKLYRDFNAVTMGFAAHTAIQV